MKKKGKELDFISCIKRDGSGTGMVKKRLIELMQDDVFKVNGVKVSALLIVEALLKTDFFEDAAVVSIEVKTMELPRYLQPFGFINQDAWQWLIFLRRRGCSAFPGPSFAQTAR